MRASYNALIDVGTNALLAIDGSTAALAYVTECIPDTAYIRDVSFPGARFVAKIFHRTDDLPAWTWDRQKRRFVPTKREVQTASLLEKSRLARAKLTTIETMLKHINRIRFKVASGLLLQESIYERKRDEAARFKASGYEEARIAEFPYVLQYAEFAGIDFRQAADEILLKARIAHDALAKTELLRLRNFKKVKDAKDPADLPALLDAFYSECYAVTV